MFDGKLFDDATREEMWLSLVDGCLILGEKLEDGVSSGIGRWCTGDDDARQAMLQIDDGVVMLTSGRTTSIDIGCTNDKQNEIASVPSHTHTHTGTTSVVGLSSRQRRVGESNCRSSPMWMGECAKTETPKVVEVCRRWVVVEETVGVTKMTWGLRKGGRKRQISEGLSV